MIGRAELRRRLRAALRGADDERAASEALARELVGDPLLHASRAFLATRRDVVAGVHLRALHADAPELMEETSFEDDEGRSLLRRECVLPADLPSRASRLLPLWKEVAATWMPHGRKAAAKTLRREFAAWLARRLDLRSTGRALARLPQTSVRIDAPVLLSRSGDRALVFEDVGAARDDGGTELPQAAWLAQAFEAGWVFENPLPQVWHRGEGNTIHVLDGPLVRLGAEATRSLERYVAATVLERRDAATDALVGLLEPRPGGAVLRELRGQIRQLVPDRDRLEGDWRDRPENNLLGHWRLVTERGLVPHPGLGAFWSGLATWERRSGDLRAAYQRWLASRTADALCSDAPTRWLTDLGEKASRWLDRPVLG